MNSTLFALLSMLLALMATTRSASTKNGTSLVKQSVPKLPTKGSKIIGGIPAKIEDYPYQVSLQTDGSHFCGGSIIDKNWGLTAAHCLYDFNGNPESLKVKYGSKNWKKGQIVKTEKIILHANYNSATYDYDIALVKFKRQISLKQKSVKSIPLAEQGKTFEKGTMVTVSGWGLTNENGDTIPTDLLAVSIPLLSAENCIYCYADIATITPRMICAKSNAGGKDACQGDSGGPLVTEINGVKTQIGVVSWGYGCARPEYPGVYASVSELRAWIKENTVI